MNELTDDQKADVESRKKEFIDEYTKLTERLQIDFGQWPSFVPVGPGTFGVIVNAQLQDKKYLTPLSPIQP